MNTPSAFDQDPLKLQLSDRLRKPNADQLEAQQEAERRVEGALCCRQVVKQVR